MHHLADMKLNLVTLVLQCSVVIRLLHHGGQAQVVGSPPSIVASVGDDITLPCHRAPPVDAASLVLEWGRPDLSPRFVHVWHEGQNLLVNQNPSYRARTSVSKDRLNQGDLSLKLSKVKVSDGGVYRCFTPKQKNESQVQLIVGAVSHPVIASIKLSSSGGVELQCESAGWYPEPELSWLDSEGQLLSAGPTETLTGPDGLYTVSSRLTVEEGNSFTCRVQQRDIKQSREALIHVSAECPSSSAAAVSISLTVVFVFVLGVLFVVWKLRNKKHRAEMKTEDQQAEQKEQLLQKNEEEQRHFQLVVDTFEEQKKKLDELREQLRNQRETIETEREELMKEVDFVEKESDKTKAFWELKKILLKDKEKVQQRKQEHERLEQNTTDLIFKVKRVLATLKPETGQTVRDGPTGRN